LPGFASTLVDTEVLAVQQVLRQRRGHQHQQGHHQQGPHVSSTAPGNPEEGGRRWCNDHGARRSYEGWTATSGWWITFAQNARAYWGAWGPLGEPMVRGVEAWAETQRAYIQCCGKPPGRGARPLPRSPATRRAIARPGGSAGEEAQEIAEEARRVASEAQREAARETESSATEARRSPEEEVRSAIRGSVRRSEAAGQEGPRAESASEEIRADAEGLPPLEGYDSLNVNRVTQRLGELSVEKIERLRDYDAENKGRRSLLARFERRIRAARGEDLRNSGETEEGPREVVSSTVREAVRRSAGEA
jgi:hypothetical protein